MNIEQLKLDIKELKQAHADLEAAKTKIITNYRLKMIEASNEYHALLCGLKYILADLILEPSKKETADASGESEKETNNGR